MRIPLYILAALTSVFAAEQAEFDRADQLLLSDYKVQNTELLLRSYLDIKPGTEDYFIYIASNGFFDASHPAFGRVMELIGDDQGFYKEIICANASVSDSIFCRPPEPVVKPIPQPVDYQRPYYHQVYPGLNSFPPHPNPFEAPQNPFQNPFGAQPIPQPFHAHQQPFHVPQQPVYVPLQPVYVPQQPVHVQKPEPKEPVHVVPQPKVVVKPEEQPRNVPSRRPVQKDIHPVDLVGAIEAAASEGDWSHLENLVQKNAMPVDDPAYRQLLMKWFRAKNDQAFDIMAKKRDDPTVNTLVVQARRGKHILDFGREGSLMERLLRAKERFNHMEFEQILFGERLPIEDRAFRELLMQLHREGHTEFIKAVLTNTNTPGLKELVERIKDGEDVNRHASPESIQLRAAFKMGNIIRFKEAAAVPLSKEDEDVASLVIDMVEGTHQLYLDALIAAQTTLGNAAFVQWVQGLVKDKSEHKHNFRLHVGKQAQVGRHQQPIPQSPAQAISQAFTSKQVGAFRQACNAHKLDASAQDTIQLVKDIFAQSETDFGGQFWQILLESQQANPQFQEMIANVVFGL